MKIAVALVAVVLATTAVDCFPGGLSRTNDDEVEVLPFARPVNPFGIVDVEANGPSSDEDDFPELGQGWRDSLSSFMKRVTDLIKNVRTQVGQDFEDKLKNGNTTSTVEIINGHKVIKNQTVYQDPHTYVKSVIFEVVPSDEDDGADAEPPKTSRRRPEVDTEAPKKKDREPLEESVENEVDALNEVATLNIETLDDKPTPARNFEYKIDVPRPEVESFEIVEPENERTTNTFHRPSNHEIESMESIDTNEIPVPIGPKFDFSHDPKPKLPEAPVSDNQWVTVAKETVFRDLSKDTMVNDLLMDQGYPINPDAELIDFNPKLVVS